MKRKGFAASLLVFCCSVPATAADPLTSVPIEEKRLVSGNQTLDPSKGYVFMHGPTRATLTLIKVPTDAERAAYRTEWQEAFDEAVRKYPRLLESWRRDVEFRRKTGGIVPPAPIEPTEQNFSIEPIERRMMVSFGPQDVYSKDDGYYSYLQQLEPGNYIYYGSFVTAARGWLTGACMCMGSVKFEVEAGKVTNLGDFPMMLWVSEEQARASQADWIPQAPPAPIDFTLPSRLTALPNMQPEWRAVGKINNFLGVVVGRMPPIPGVLAYERDRVIDLRAAENTGSGGAS